MDIRALAEATAGIVREHVDKAVAPLLGRIAELEAREPVKGDPGKDVDPEHVADLVRSTADAILSGWERPKDGISVKPEELRPIVVEEAQRAVSAIPVPKDGANLADAVIDRDGNLVLMLSDGRAKSLGRIDGKDADEEAIFTRLVDRIPAPAETIALFAPDEVAEDVTRAIKMLAGFVPAAERQVLVPSPASQPPAVTVHMSPLNVSFPEQAAPVVNLTAPAVTVEPTVVNVELPKKGKERTTVTGYDDKGRIKSFEKVEE